MVICFYKKGNEWMNKNYGRKFGMRTCASAHEREKKVEEGLKVMPHWLLFSSQYLNLC